LTLQALAGWLLERYRATFGGLATPIEASQMGIARNVEAIRNSMGEPRVKMITIFR